MGHSAFSKIRAKNDYFRLEDMVHLSIAALNRVHITFYVFVTRSTEMLVLSPININTKDLIKHSLQWTPFVVLRKLVLFTKCNISIRQWQWWTPAIPNKCSKSSQIYTQRVIRSGSTKWSDRADFTAYMCSRGDICSHHILYHQTISAAAWIAHKGLWIKRVSKYIYSS